MIELTDEERRHAARARALLAAENQPRWKHEAPWMGVTPFGYVKKHGRLHPGQAAAYIRMAFEMAGRDETPAEIASTLMRLEIPGPRGPKWSPHAVRRILANQIYTGFSVYRVGDWEETTATPWTQIVEPALFDRVQRLKHARARRSTEDWIEAPIS